jgi:hypothetical protein
MTDPISNERLDELILDFTTEEEFDCFIDAIAALHELKALREQYTQLIEIWHGGRKVSIYPNTVIRVWGVNFETEMSDEPRTLESTQSAVDWLYCVQQSPAQALSSNVACHLAARLIEAEQNARR